MNIQPTANAQRDIWEFSRWFINWHGADAVFDPELLANAFRQYYGLRGVLSLNRIRSLALGELGISRLSHEKLPGDERAIYFIADRLISILYKEDDWSGSQEFSIGHELREIIGAIIEDFSPGFTDLAGEELENNADAFAAALFMDTSEFLEIMASSGMDPMVLHSHFNKAYIGVVARIATVLRRQKPSVQFWGSIIEIASDLPKGFGRCGCFHRSV